ncbi:MAG: tol-pal system protein YbgF [Rhodospirillales bacterium]|nr:tol-pal system protein YbgF [Rhodospirillales bacterium]MDE0380299.1 tol-pal system protein YbgF [Rhodospirillales bacterium]
MIAAPATALAVLLAGAVLLTATEASAQSTGELRVQIRNLTNQISSLRGQLADLERVVHGGGESQGTGPGAGEEGSASERNSRRLAELEADIDEAREWRRRVTGHFEEFDNTLRRLEDRIERLVADVDFRLSALEQGQTGVTGSAAVAPVGEQSAVAPAGQDQAAIAGQPGEGYELSAEPQVLGTIPADEAVDEPPLAVLTPDEQYSEAFGLLEEARFEEAHDAFTRFIDANPTHDRAQNAAYWRAESLYARKMYPEAAKAYALNLRQYPEGRKAPDNMVKLGMALLKLGRSDEACRTFAQLDRNFPDPPLNIRRAAQQGQRQANCP